MDSKKEKEIRADERQKTLTFILQMEKMHSGSKSILTVLDFLKDLIKRQ